ncbi:MAG TPA: hypothetical protein VFQ65_02150 [Kofleriaceae bacterium]|nr:hypothetical protein [Kofleriaceae bacterium]
MVRPWGEREQPIQVRAGRAALAEPCTAAIADGLVTLGGLALPIDDAAAELSADGKVVLGWSAHYVVG